MNTTECVRNEALEPKDFKSDYKPIWCPGCGDYAVLSSITKALSVLGVKRENAAIISGIGCSSRIPAYTSLYGFHGVHGRALALATGVKIARPELTVLVTGGDGDGFLDRRQPLPACLPPQRRPDLCGHGQPGLRHDQGPGLADHRVGMGGQQAHPARHRRQPRSSRSASP